MNGRQLATEMGFPTSGLHYLDESDGRSAVVAGYTTGRSSLLVQSPIFYRPPGSSIWLVRCDPRETGDGPSYMIDAQIAERFSARQSPIPPVPDLAGRLAEDRGAAANFTKNQLELNESETRYWQTVAIADFKEEASLAPGRLAGFYARVAGAGIKTVSGLIGTAAGAFYGTLPFWVQVMIPVTVVGVGVAGAVSVVRTFRPPAGA